MKPSLQLKLSQHLALTPQLQQSIRLLQLSTLELEQELEKYLQDNPLLERVEEEYAPPPVASDAQSSEPETAKPEIEEPPSSSADEDSWLGEESSYSSSSGSFDDDDNEHHDVQAATTSLCEHLSWQLGLMNIPDRDRTLVECLIGALDEDGYLSQSLDELAEALPAELEIEREELQIALKHLQNFDPTGVGARNAPECLALQLDALPADATQVLALRIVRGHLELLASRDFAKLKKLLDCNDDQLRAAQFLICSLNPRPGAQYAPLDARYITPDVVLRKLRGQWTVTINGDAFPRLRINSLYAQILSKQRGSSLAGQLQEARWLLKSLEARGDTLLRVTRCLLRQQAGFLEFGEQALRPLTLREVALEVGLHESTVSRAIARKYVRTPRGTLPLRAFFASGVGTEGGGEASSIAIQSMIRRLIEAENPRKPLSDAKLADLLKESGIPVARRTVAKYREAMDILSSHERVRIG